MITLGTLPPFTPFAPQQLYGIALQLVAADPNLQFEIQRAPDIAGAPGAYTSLGNVGPYPRGQGVYIDWWASDLTITGFWYQARHVGPNVDPGPFSPAVGPVAPYLVRRALYEGGLQEPIGVDGLTDGRTYRKTANMAGGDNLAENGNFEAATALVPVASLDHTDWPLVYCPPGWEGYNSSDSTFSYETSTQYSGAQSLKMVTLHNGAGMIMLKRLKASAGEYWKISAAMKISSGTARFSIVPRNGANTALAEFQVDCTQTAWTIGAAVGQLPAGTVQLTVHAYMPSNGTAYFDDLVVMRSRGASELLPAITAETLGIRGTTLACYSFGEGTGLTTADHVGQVDLVFATGAGWASDIGGNGCYVFGNVDARTALANHVTAHDIGTGQDLTVDVVLRYDGVSSVNTEVCLVCHENDYEMAIDHSNQLKIASRDHWTGQVVGIDFSKYLGRWTHVKWTYTTSTSTTKIYIDGVLAATHVDTGSASGTAIADVLEIGHRAAVGTGSTLNGVISYVRVSKGIQNDFPFLDIAQMLRTSTGIDTNGNVQSGILPSVGIVEGNATSKIYRHREDIQVTGADTDGDVAVTFGQTYQNAPQVTFRGGQFVSYSSTLPAGKQRTRLQVLSLSSSGFTSRCQIASVGGTTAQDDDFPNGNSTTTVGGTAVAALAPGGANDNNYTVNYRGSVTVDANGSNFCTATLVVAIDTDDGTGYVERATYSYSASPLSGPPPYSAATTTFTAESKTITVSGLTGATKNIRLRIKSLTITNGGTGSCQLSGFDGAGTVSDAGVHGVTYTTATDTTESGIPSNGDQVLWAAQEVA